MSGLFFLKNNEEAIDSRRDPAENGLQSFDLESRFSAVLLKAAEMAYCQIGARCRLPTPRPEADYATRGGISIWSEKSSFPMGLRNR
jgi:hypothetical protein